MPIHSLGGDELHIHRPRTNIKIPFIVTLHVVTVDGGDNIGERDVTFTATMYRCIIGRSSKSGNSLLKASKNNFRFDNRVVSRNHAEVFVDVKKKVSQLSCY